MPPRLPAGPAARAAAIGLGCAALVAAFVLWRLPYDRLGAALAAAGGRATSLELEIGALSPSLSWLGPGVEATRVRVAAPNGAALPVERLRLRPAWSPQWLRLRPRLWLDAELAGGRAAGELGLAPGPSFSGRLADLDLERLPLAAFWPGAELRGRLDATLDLRPAPRGAAGEVALAARDGSATLPTLPLALPFATLTARLEPGDDPRLRVASLELEGTLLRARGSGTLGAARRLAQAPLDLALELAVEPDLRPALAGLGLRLRPDGRARLRIGGTIDAPVVLGPD